MNNEEVRTNDEPQWLDDVYVRKILNAYTENQLDSLMSFTKMPATAKGENFASAMHLLNAKYSLKTAPNSIKEISMIVKSRLDNELIVEIQENFNVFEREAQVYTNFMPAAEKLLSLLGDDTIFGPKPIYVDKFVIVQQNLKSLGYNIANVKQGLNLEECRLILEKLAKFHAVSMVLYKQQPEMFQPHLPGNVSENPTPLHELYINAIKTCITYCRSNDALKKYVEKLKDFGDHIIPKMINVFSRHQTDRYHVLNHGDIWVNNLMFRKSDAGKVQDVLFVDYQEGFYGSPGIDWNYFMFTSWQLDVFQNHFVELLSVYHKNLSDVLMKLKHEERIPTLEDVQKEIINKGFHGLATATCLLPILINEHEGLADPENFLLETDAAIEKRNIIFSNPKYGERLEVFLSYFVEKEIL